MKIYAIHSQGETDWIHANTIFAVIEKLEKASFEFEDSDGIKHLPCVALKDAINIIAALESESKDEVSDDADVFFIGEPDEKQKPDCDKCVYMNKDHYCWVIKTKANPANVNCDFREKEEQKPVSAVQIIDKYKSLRENLTSEQFNDIQSAIYDFATIGQRFTGRDAGVC